MVRKQYFKRVRSFVSLSLFNLFCCYIYTLIFFYQIIQQVCVLFLIQNIINYKLYLKIIFLFILILFINMYNVNCRFCCLFAAPCCKLANYIIFPFLFIFFTSFKNISFKLSSLSFVNIIHYVYRFIYKLNNNNNKTLVTLYISI